MTISVFEPVSLPPADVLARFRVAQTLRAPVESTWAAQMLAIAFVIVDTPDKANSVMAAMSDLDTIWTVGLSVLGIYVYKRSQEKMKRPI